MQLLNDKFPIFLLFWLLLAISWGYVAFIFVLKLAIKIHWGIKKIMIEKYCNACNKI